MIPFSSTAKLTALCAIVLTASFTVHAQTQTVLYTFTGQPDGATPNGGLVMDAKGNLYGTTFSGGSFGGGTAFKLMPDGKETLLHSFAGGADGMGPGAGLIRAGAKLYGTTAEGGANSFGTVFEVTKIGSEGVLAALSIQDGGGYPEGAPLRDKQGYLYETITGYNGGYGNGAVFKISPSGALSMLYEFKGGVDGLCPYGNLVEDSNGNLYGTTYRGGTSGRGNVYKISPDGTETVLYSFSGGVDGDLPAAGLVRDSKGNLYGTTTGGGTEGYGTVFVVTPGGTETVLHSFIASDGFYPSGNLVRDAKGNLYGSTLFGGSHGQGNIFKLTKSGTITNVYNFTGGADGGWPNGSLLLDKQGNLYGTTTYGGNSNCLDGCGVVFKLTP